MYSVFVPMMGETVFFFSDSYIGQAPSLAGDGTALTDSAGLRTRAVNCTPEFGCFPATNLYRAHNSIVVRDLLGTKLRTITGPLSADGYSTSYFTPATAGHFYWVADSVLGIDDHGTPKIFTFLMEWDGSLNYYGAAIAQLSIPSLSIDSIQPIVNDPSDDPVHWGVFRAPRTHQTPDSPCTSTASRTTYPILRLALFATVCRTSRASIFDSDSPESQMQLTGWSTIEILAGF